MSHDSRDFIIDYPITSVIESIGKMVTAKRYHLVNKNEAFGIYTFTLLVFKKNGRLPSMYSGNFTLHVQVKSVSENKSSIVVTTGYVNIAFPNQTAPLGIVHIDDFMNLMSRSLDGQNISIPNTKPNGERGNQGCAHLVVIFI